MIPRDLSNPAYVFVPEDRAQELPALYATQNEVDPIAHLKFFTPDSCWTWYCLEYDPQQRLCFGLVVGHEREVGYFSLDELETVRGPLGLPIERDLYWEPTRLSECP